MAERKEFLCKVDLDDLAAEVGRVEEIGDRVRLAGYGLAAPLVKAREGQLRREVKRTANRKGARHPEVARREADLARAEARFALFREETERARLTRPSLETETGAAVWGRVVDDGRPVTDVTVSVVAKGERLDFRCTDDVGGFAMEVPPAVGFVLSVRAKDGGELFRDGEPQSLSEGQVLYREIDLSRAAEEPCPEPPPEDGGDEEDEAYPMVDLVGRREADALALIRGQGLKLEDRKEQEVEGQAGLVIAQQPAAGTPVRRGDGVSIVVGASGRVRVPDVIGLKLKEAEQALKKAGLGLGTVSEVPVTGERGGLVVAQDPNAGAEIARGDKVALSVGKASEDRGGDEVPVPDVVGMKLEEAQVTLKRAELRLGETKKVPAEGDKVGLVLEQDPAAGKRVAVGTRITLAVGMAREDSGDDQRVRRIAGLAEERLREAGVIAADQPQGTVAQWLARAGVRKTADVDRLLTVDRQRLRERFGLRTLADTDKVIAALKRARSQVPD